MRSILSYFCAISITIQQVTAHDACERGKNQHFPLRVLLGKLRAGVMARV